MNMMEGGGGGDTISDDTAAAHTTNLLLSPPQQQPSSWRLKIDHFRLPQTSPNSSSTGRFSGFRHLFRPTPRKRGKVQEYYKKQERLLEGFNEMETINESGCLPEGLTEDEMKNLAKSERMAITVSNVANLVLFIAKVYASIESRSLAVIASTLDSLLDLLSGFILWFTSYAMRNPNHFHYPIGKTRMQPVGIIVFASVMGTLGFQILLESARQLVAQTKPDMNPDNEKWVIGIMVGVTVVKFMLMVYCKRFKNEIVRAYAQDHFFDVVTNSVGLVSSVLAVRYKWWIDPVGAIIIALYTISTWARTVMENVRSLIGRTAPPDFLAKLTYLVWNHHEEIKHIDTVRAYTFGSQYFVEVDIVLPEDMLLHKAHNIGEMLQEKLEQLPEVERAFVHIDFEFSHRPEHKAKAYVQQLESSRIRLTQLEQDLQRARSQGLFMGGGGGGGGNLSPGAAIFDMEYTRWLDDDQRHMGELRKGLQSHLSDGDLRIIVDSFVAHYDEIFRLKGVAAKSDVFHLITGMWTTPAERCFLWMGGFRPSELIKMLELQLDPLTEQQVVGIYSLQQSSQQAEEALSQGLDQLHQSLVDTIASGSVNDGVHHMAVALGKLTNLEGFVRQADNLRQQTLHQLHRILTVRQAAKCFLVISEYYGRLRALSSLWASRPCEAMISDENSCQTTTDLQMVQSSQIHFSNFG